MPRPLAAQARILLIPALLLLALAQSPALAENATASNATQEAPRAEKAPAVPRHAAIPVTVEHSGEDRLGEMLAFQLKEAFGRTVSFRPAKDKEKALRVRVVTAVEIADRPDFGSAYSVTWLFSEGPNVLSYYLDGAVGFVQPAKVKEEAESLTARTDKAVSKFGYLFK